MNPRHRQSMLGPVTKLRCPLARRSPNSRACKGGFPSVSYLNEHLKKVHLNSVAEGIASIDQDDIDRVRNATSKNRKAAVRTKYQAIRRALFPTGEEDDARTPVYIPTIDEAKSMAAAMSKRAPGTKNTLATFQSLCQSDNPWFRGLSEDAQLDQLLKACSLFPSFLTALGITGAFPESLQTESKGSIVAKVEKREESKETGNHILQRELSNMSNFTSMGTVNISPDCGFDIGLSDPWVWGGKETVLGHATQGWDPLSFGSPQGAPDIGTMEETLCGIGCGLRSGWTC